LFCPILPGQTRAPTACRVTTAHPSGQASENAELSPERQEEGGTSLK